MHTSFCLFFLFFFLTVVIMIWIQIFHYMHYFCCVQNKNRQQMSDIFFEIFFPLSECFIYFYFLLISKVFRDNSHGVEILAAVAQSKINHPKNPPHVIITSYCANVISHAFLLFQAHIVVIQVQRWMSIWPIFFAVTREGLFPLPSKFEQEIS